MPEAKKNTKIGPSHDTRKSGGGGPKKDTKIGPSHDTRERAGITKKN